MSTGIVTAVAVGGFLGAIARHAVAGPLNRRHGPYGTVSVNLAGVFLAGLFLHPLLDGLLYAFFIYGFLGSFTTFSTWQSEIVAMWRDRHRGRAAAYSAGMLAAGILFAWLGWLTGTL